MKKIQLIIYLLLSSLSVYSQVYEREYSGLEKFIIKNTIDKSIDFLDIKMIDFVDSDDIKRPLVEKLRGYPYFDHLVDNYEVFKDEFKTIDLNNDGKLDIFYSGSLGGASDSYSYIFLNNGDELVRVFSGDMGLFIYAGMISNKLKGLIYCYEGTAADCPELSHIDLISFDEMEVKVSNIVSFPNDVALPKSYFKIQTGFKVKNEKYYLRSQPEIYNANNGCGLNGNIHYIYTMGDKGKAYASETDETGRVWYFVIMQNNIAGWMSSRYLEEE